MLIMLFMAVTSTGSSEQIAVSSLFAYDVYREYFNREATGKDVRSFPCCTFECAWVHTERRHLADGGQCQTRSELMRFALWQILV